MRRFLIFAGVIASLALTAGLVVTFSALQGARAQVDAAEERIAKMTTQHRQCVSALDAADEAFTVISDDGLAHVSAILTAASVFDLDGMESATARLGEGMEKFNAVSPRYVDSSVACRG